MENTDAKYFNLKLWVSWLQIDLIVLGLCSQKWSDQGKLLILLRMKVKIQI